MIIILIILYAFTVALVTATTLLLRAALGDRRRMLKALLTPLACEGVVPMIFGKVEGGMADMVRQFLYLYILLLPGGLLGAFSRWR
ncbi:hypothetical protein QH494_24250 [Sphingomonas sp. AR_OL41]|uniref:hypothetical protein n=1 Tax=Sphingomonas sp. AR_OL41 TaxID=3042729 RepID=UPI00247FBA1D|nr:hypothetical protein [Sphingomonas sp. AR_OL41]MDH7975310.1 hypothetical protein [Sphingomonas sp. AR_OL41]